MFLQKYRLLIENRPASSWKGFMIVASRGEM